MLINIYILLTVSVYVVSVFCVSGCASVSEVGAYIHIENTAEAVKSTGLHIGDIIRTQFAGRKGQK